MSINRIHYKAFTTIIEMLSRKHERGRVFSDVLQMGICAMHQMNIASGLKEKDPANEELYLETIAPYNKEELNDYGKLLGILQASVYDAPYSDLLGEYFTEYITQGQNGQFFTPNSICKLMARMQGTDDQVELKKVLDPACGSGRLLLAFAEVAPNNYFYAGDVSITCAKMTALNFMLNGLHGEVSCMNALSLEWYQGWKINTPVLGFVPIQKEQSRIWARPPEKPPLKRMANTDSSKFNNPQQLSFF